MGRHTQLNSAIAMKFYFYTSVCFVLMIALKKAMFI